VPVILASVAPSMNEAGPCPVGGLPLCWNWYTGYAKNVVLSGIGVQLPAKALEKG
jgi:hypothetical protein